MKNQISFVRPVTGDQSFRLFGGKALAERDMLGRFGGERPDIVMISVKVQTIHVLHGEEAVENTVVMGAAVMEPSAAQRIEQPLIMMPYESVVVLGV